MAYAAVALLAQNLEEILRVNPTNKDNIESLQKEVSFLQSFLFKLFKRGYHDPQSVKEMELLITNVAYKASDFISSLVYLTNTRYSFPPERRIGWNKIALTSNQCSFTHMIDEFKSVIFKVIRLSENISRGGEAGNSRIQLPFAADEEKLVGISDEAVETLLDRLTGQSSQLQVIPILGMGGIGKTTLANRLYNHVLVVERFYMRAWTTVPQVLLFTDSPSHQMREMLLCILKCFDKITFTDVILKNKYHELGEKMYKCLKGRQYLVVLDNMWHKEVWDSLRMYFPDDRNGSRIILTTRVKHVAAYVSPESSPHYLHLLSSEESWELLMNNVFAQKTCPPDLIEIGKQIARKCQGLPIAIVVVAGLLGKISQTLESWSEIAESVNARVAEDPKQCIDILALSYDYLPNHLKACFLYMGAFPGEYEIPVSKLAWLWIAEGFIQPVPGEICLEDVADEYLEDLVSRNLVLVGRKRSNGRIKTCHVHDLLRELCTREAQKDNFLHLIKQLYETCLIKSINPSRISLHDDILHFNKSRAFPLLHSFMCFDANKVLPDMFLLELIETMDFKLLRVLDIILVQSNHFPSAILELVQLRYLALAVNSDIPGSISKLQSLQTLIIDHIWEGLHLPDEIWELTQLRHLHVKRGCFFPPAGVMVLENLQTLSTLILGATSCSEEIFARLPQLRKLAIYETESDFQEDCYSKCISNLVLLKQVETFKCCFLYGPRMHHLPNCSVFPPKLKKLTLSGSSLSWKDMDVLGELPNLEVLKLKSYAFAGHSWEPIEGGFLELRILVIEKSDPIYWIADSSHFPILQRLVLRNCKRLTKIPQDIGDIETLVMIELHDCATSLVDSARELREEQEMLGNDELRILITWSDNHHPLN